MMTAAEWGKQLLSPVFFYPSAGNRWSILAVHFEEEAAV
jgi:hypothetical protein